MQDYLWMVNCQKEFLWVVENEGWVVKVKIDHKKNETIFKIKEGCQSRLATF